MASITSTRPTTTASESHRHRLARAAGTSGLIAAAATTAVAAAADAAGVPLAVDGAAIPLLGFAQLTLVGVLVGSLVAAALNRATAGRSGGSSALLWRSPPCRASRR